MFFEIIYDVKYKRNNNTKRLIKNDIKNRFK